MYKPVNAKVHFPDMEMNILDFWQTHNIFHKSIKQRENADRFIFYDGPSFCYGTTALWPFCARNSEGCYSTVSNDERVQGRSSVWVGLSWASCGIRNGERAWYFGGICY